MFQRNIVLRLSLVLAMVIIFSFGLTGSAQAFEYYEESNLPAGETIDDDLFIAGEKVVVDGTVNGDLLAFAETVVVNGTVNGSLITGAQFVEINGKVTGSVYNGSNATTLGSSAEIGRNVYFGGFSLTVEDGARVGRDLAAGGYQAILNGNIGRDVVAGAGAIEIGGAVGGDVKIEVGSPDDGVTPMFYMPPGTPAVVSPGLRVLENAKIGGELAYSSPVDQSENIAAAPDGGVNYSMSTPDHEVPTTEVNPIFNVGRWFLQRARELVTLLALGALVIWQLPDLFGKAVNKAASEPLPASGWGLVTIFGGYIAAAIAAGLVLAAGIFFGILTLGGLGRTIFGVGFSSLGAIMAVFTLLVSYGSKLVLAFWAGQWTVGKFLPQRANSKAWAMVLGVLIYVVLRAIPFLGWIFGTVVTLMGMGAIWLVFQDWRKPTAVAETA